MRSRAESARYLNALAKEELFERYGITRIGNITGFDILGVPVYNAIRPTAKVLSVNSGKGLSKSVARAGAIGEAIEYATFERPQGNFQVRAFGDFSKFDLLPLALGSQFSNKTPIPLEIATHFANGQECLFPSDLLWMVHRRQKRMDFQMTSNGQAVGYCFEDAFLAGLYECVERDATTLARYTFEQTAILPPRVALCDCLEPFLSMVADAGLKLFLFYCTVDVPLPVYWAMLVDPSLGGFFTTAGWGCDISSARAARKAIVEAIQARCVYIAGARDDLLTSDYDEHKAHDPSEQIAVMEQIPASHTLGVYDQALSVQEELKLVLNRLGAWRENIYFKTIDIDPLVAVKTVILGLEPPRNALWVPSRRSIMQVQACTDAAQNREGESSGVLPQSLVTFCETLCASGLGRSV